MPVAKLTCPECGANLKTAAPLTKKKRIQCPGCEAVFPVPKHLVTEELRAAASAGGGKVAPGKKSALAAPRSRPAEDLDDVPGMEEAFADTAGAAGGDDFAEEAEEAYAEEPVGGGDWQDEAAAEPAGEHADEAVAEDYADEYAEEMTEPVAAKPKKKKSKGALVLVIALLLLAGLGVGGYFAYEVGWLDGVLQAIGLKEKQGGAPPPPPDQSGPPKPTFPGPSLPLPTPPGPTLPVLTKPPPLPTKPGPTKPAATTSPSVTKPPATSPPPRTKPAATVPPVTKPMATPPKPSKP
jgi:hypothetical protein